jgi:hypothetical protein
MWGTPRRLKGVAARGPEGLADESPLEHGEAKAIGSILVVPCDTRRHGKRNRLLQT